MDEENYVVEEVSHEFFEERHLLLQESLRPSFSHYPIEEEYPTLFSDGSQGLSLGLFKKDHKNRQLIAHLNLLEKKIGSFQNPEKNFSIGLIGNVATSVLFRGKGVMSQLLKKTIQLATEKSLHALILWGDQSSFYHKFGFEAFGSEYRFKFSKKKLSELKTKTDFFVPLLDELSDDFFNTALTMRPLTPFYCLRNPSEFRSLLTIPDTILLVEGKSGVKQKSAQQFQNKSFLIMGKGYDMIGVIHEWGGKSLDQILAGIKYILDVTDLENVQLLAPQQLEEKKFNFLKNWSDSVENHPIGLVKHLSLEEVSVDLKKEFKESFDKAYFWGLDSI